MFSPCPRQKKMLNFRLVEVVIWRIHLGSNKNSCQTHGLVIFLLHCNANSLMLEILKWQNLGTICISVPHSKFCRTRTPTPRESWCMPMTFPPKTTSIRLATMHQRYTETDTRTHTHTDTHRQTHTQPAKRDYHDRLKTGKNSEGRCHELAIG